MMAPARIFSTHTLHPDVTDALQSMGHLSIASSPSPSAIDAESHGADLIVVRAPIDPKIITRETSLKACVRHGAGLDMIPVEVATNAGVLVANVPGANARTVAEHAIWSALALMRLYPEVHADLHQKGWAEARAHSDRGRELSGKTIGIVGMGNVGIALSRIAQHGFDMQVFAHTRRPDTLKNGVIAASLDVLLAKSDVVVLCCPLTPKTRGMIGATQFETMRSGAVLINVARGPVVDETALIAALQQGKIGGAALDVFDTQPLPRDHPFLAVKNLILTPHMAGITEESMRRMGMGVVEEIALILAGKQPKNFCNPEVWGTYSARFA